MQTGVLLYYITSAVVSLRCCLLRVFVDNAALRSRVQHKWCLWQTFLPVFSSNMVTLTLGSGIVGSDSGTHNASLLATPTLRDRWSTYELVGPVLATLTVRDSSGAHASRRDSIL